MGIFDSLRGGADADAPRQAAVAPNGLPADDGRTSLERRRDELLAQVAELHWDLGGLAYEMAIRDHFRLDVLVRRAAELQERDAELGELERVLSADGQVETGTCPGCGAVHGRGALYCWQCGKTLMERVPSSAADASAGEPPAGGQSEPPVREQSEPPVRGQSEPPVRGQSERPAEEQTLVLPPSAPVG